MLEPRAALANTDRGTDECQDQTLMEHDGHDVAACRSHRDADAEFAASLPIAKFFTRARNRLRILMTNPPLSL